MLEFGVRVLLAGAIVFVAGVFGLFDFGWTCGAAIGFGLLALLSLPEIRKEHPGATASLHGSLDAVAVAVLLASSDRSESLGFLAMLPYAFVAVRHGASWKVGALSVPLALVAGQALVQHSDPSAGLLLQGGAVLILGFVLGAARPLVQEYSGPMVLASPLSADDELRARNRALREAVDLLRRRSEEASHTAALLRAPSGDAIAQAVRNATLAEGAALFVASSEGFAPVGVAGILPPDLNAVHSSRDLQTEGATILHADGIPVGAIWVNEEARSLLPSLANALAERLKELVRAVVVRKIEREAAARTDLIGHADDPLAVAAALAEQVRATSLEFGLVGPDGPVPMGQYGPPCALTEALRNGDGTGLAGWAAAGAPMVWISDVRADNRLDRSRALRARASTFALVSLADGRAYAWAAWNEPGVAKPAAIAELKTAETALNRWIGRIKAAA